MKCLKITLGTQILQLFIFDEKSEQEAIDEANAFLSANDANDGMTMKSVEDCAGVNVHLAEKYNDPLNEEGCVELLEDEEAYEEAVTFISERFCEHNWSEKMLRNLIEDLG